MTQDRIVVGIDGSPVAREALRWASRLVARLGGELVVVHALGLLEPLHGELLPGHHHAAEIEDVMAREWCAALARSGVAHRTIVREGHPVDVLVGVAREEDARLLVVGSRGIGDTQALVLGSTSLQLLRQAPVPVLVVPDREQAVHHLALRRIVVALDGSPEGMAAVDVAGWLGRGFGSQIELVRAVEELPVFPLGPAARTTGEGEWEAPQRARRQAEPFCAAVRRRDLPVHLEVQRGNADEVVRSVAARLDADLVVMATRRAGRPDDALLDSVSRRIVRVAHRPTLVVPIPATSPATSPAASPAASPADTPAYADTLH
jgi:nucleotide-binding universal stress UspA family protein